MTFRDIFHDDWKDIVKKAWSVRLAAVAGLLSAVTVIMGVMVTCGSSRTFMLAFIIVSIMASIAGFSTGVARLMKQSDMTKPSEHS